MITESDFTFDVGLRNILGLKIGRQYESNKYTHGEKNHNTKDCIFWY